MLWLLLLVGSGAARAGPVTPIVTSPTAAAISSGVVPVDLMHFDIDAQPTHVLVTSTITNAPSGAETAEGTAQVDVDTMDINASVVRGRSRVSTAPASPPVPDGTQSMINGSVAGFSATLSTDGLSTGNAAIVDLLLSVSGSLTYSDPSGSAITVIDPDLDIAVAEMSASVSVILSLAAPLTIPSDPADVPDPLPLLPLFNGSATLRSPMVAGGLPELVLEGGWLGRAGDFTLGTCSAVFCEVSVSTLLPFLDVQSLGFNQMFDIALLLQTGADAISGTGRTVESDFFNSARVGVALTALDAGVVPEPGTLALLSLALAALGFSRRRQLH